MVVAERRKLWEGRRVKAGGGRVGLEFEGEPLWCWGVLECCVLYVMLVVVLAKVL